MFEPIKVILREFYFNLFGGNKMEERNFEMPNLETMDVNSPDYAAKLEAGWLSIGDEMRAVEKEVKDLSEGADGGLVAVLQEAGIETKTVPHASIMMIGMGSVSMHSIAGLCVSDESQVDRALMITEAYEEKVEETKEKYFGRLETLAEAKDGFKKSILDLTKVEPLNTINPENAESLFYVVHSGDSEDAGVYLGRVELDCKVTSGKEKEDKEYSFGLFALLDHLMSTTPTVTLERQEDLNPEAFGDEGYMGDFKARQKGVTGQNVYLVTNPTTIVAAKALLQQGFEESKKDICVGCEKYDIHAKKD